MKIVFATNNQTKSKRFSKGLSKYNIEVVSLKDLNIKLDVIESGTTAIENALLKARECFKKTGIPTIGMDDTLYLEGVPDSIQPGLFVRRVNGKTLSDEEMIEYYSSLVRKYGINNKINCKWVYGLAVIDKSGNESTYTWYKDNFYMSDIPSNKVNIGYPLNTISKYKKIDKYFTDELTEDEKKIIAIKEDDVIEFIKNHV